MTGTTGESQRRGRPMVVVALSVGGRAAAFPRPARRHTAGRGRRGRGREEGEQEGEGREVKGSDWLHTTAASHNCCSRPGAHRISPSRAPPRRVKTDVSVECISPASTIRVETISSTPTMSMGRDSSRAAPPLPPPPTTMSMGRDSSRAKEPPDSEEGEEAVAAASTRVHTTSATTYTGVRGEGEGGLRGGQIQAR